MRFFFLFGFIAVSIFAAAAVTQPQTVTVQHSPTSPWIEVYHDGELTSEWQPSDGAVYEFLETLLNDDLGPFPVPRRPSTRLASLL